MKKILWYRLLDAAQSWYNTRRKERDALRKWPGPIMSTGGPASVTGNQEPHMLTWRDMVRSGRRYSRVRPIALPWIPQGEFANGAYEIRPEPGWEWVCQNCHSYSIITDSMMPVILQAWEEMRDKTISRGFRFTTPRPTAATAGCPECRFLPGAPE